MLIRHHTGLGSLPLMRDADQLHYRQKKQVIMGVMGHMVLKGTGHNILKMAVAASLIRFRFTK